MRFTELWAPEMLFGVNFLSYNI